MSGQRVNRHPVHTCRTAVARDRAKRSIQIPSVYDPFDHSDPFVEPPSVRLPGCWATSRNASCAPRSVWPLHRLVLRRLSKAGRLLRPLLTAQLRHPLATELSPGKGIFFPPIRAGSTILAFRSSGPLWTSVWCATSSSRMASYPIPVRRYRVLQVGFLQCRGHPLPPCHLLELRGTTPALKGLPPSRRIRLYSHRRQV
jgi:hypothetical protein